MFGHIGGCLGSQMSEASCLHGGQNFVWCSSLYGMGVSVFRQDAAVKDKQVLVVEGTKSKLMSSSHSTNVQLFSSL